VKIKFEENKINDEIEVIIKGNKDDETVKDIYKSLTYFQTSIIGKDEGRMISLSLNEVFYFDTVDNKTFAYLKDKVFEVNQRLYQLEETLESTPFLRVNKNTIVNSKKIKSFKSMVNGRMEAMLKNGERIKISRTYVQSLKRKLGGDDK